MANVQRQLMRQVGLFAFTTDIEGRYQTPYTTSCNGVVNHGAQFGVLWVFADHTRAESKRKTNALTIFARRAAFGVSLFSRSARSTCN